MLFPQSWNLSEVMRRAHNCDQFNHFVFHVINVIAASCDDSGYF